MAGGAEVSGQSELLFERARKVSPGGVHSPVRSFRGVGGVPRFIRSASGSRLFDVDGNRYTDYCMSWGPLIFGHGDPEVQEAIMEALGRGWSYGAAEPYSLELAELITGSLPWVEKIRFVNSGTEAVMSAARVARAATGRNRLIKFDGCYHGHFDPMLVRAGSGLAGMASPDSAGVSPAVAAETIVVPLDDLQALENALQLHGGEVAGILVEGVPANNGLLVQKEGFLSRVAELARGAGALLILDEVITGFRVGFGGIAEKEGLTPDLVCYGKVIGGGFPVGAYGGRADLMDLVAPAGPVYQAGTLSANPVAMSAGISMLRKLKRDHPFANLEARTERLAARLEAVSREAGVSIRVQRLASMFWIVLGEIKTPDGAARAITDIPPTQKERYGRVFHHLLDHGIYLAPSGHEVSFLSTTHLEQDFDQLVEMFKGAIAR